MITQAVRNVLRNKEKQDMLERALARAEKTGSPIQCLAKYRGHQLVNKLKSDPKKELDEPTLEILRAWALLTSELTRRLI